MLATYWKVLVKIGFEYLWVRISVAGPVVYLAIHMLSLSLTYYELNGHTQPTTH